MFADQIRCTNDKKLHESLMQAPEVIQVNTAIEKMEAKGPSGTRRRLLSTSVRLSQTMAPDLHKMKDDCMDRLGLEIPLELYAYNSPQFNAACVKPEDGRLFIMFSSSLLEAFTGNELKFVMGHELGHHLYHHHDIPVGYLLKGPKQPGPKLALQLFTWSRYAEISADRAGAHCAQDFESVARSLFRLASGLSDNVVKFSLKEFLRQLDDMQIEDEDPAQGASQEDWFSTHPFSPLRVKALQLYHDSEYETKSGISSADLELGVQGVMGFMEPSYLEGRTKSAEIMRRLLFSGAIAVASADGEISEKEVSVFESLFGEGAFTEKLNVDRIKQDLPGRIENAREKTSLSQRMQVLRDLCLIVKADSSSQSRKRQVLIDICEALNVFPVFVESQLEADRDLD
ncbi:MAG: tellurite resistance protein [Parasphingorhabdus sp.]|jgi:tellurite resistance protein